MQVRQHLDHSKGKMHEIKVEDEQFDYAKAKQALQDLIKPEFPETTEIWTTTWDIDERFIDRLAKVTSPRRRAIWKAVCEVDVIVPEIMRSKAATMLQYSYRGHTARLELRANQIKRSHRVAIILQSNIRVMLSRKVWLPRRKEAIRDELQAKRIAEEKEAQRKHLLSLKVTAVAKLSEAEKLVWILHQAEVTEAMAKRLLKLCEGDPGKALMLCKSAEERVKSRGASKDPSRQPNKGSRP